MIDQMQLQAGYVLSSVVSALIEAGYEKHKIESLLTFHSYFDIQTSFQIRNNKSLPIIEVAENIIIRGLPTLASIFLEQYFIEKFDRIEKKIDDTGSIIISFKEKGDELISLLYKALHIIKPRTDKIGYENNRFGSEYEKDFILRLLPEVFGNYIIQLIETQRTLDSIIRFSDNTKELFEKYINGSIDTLKEQRVDLSVEFPYTINDSKGFVIEIDGPQHQDEGNRILDALRDEAIKKAGWAETIRIKTDEINQAAGRISTLNKFYEDDYFRVLKENFENPIWDTENGKIAIELVLTPIAVARIHRVLFLAIKNNVLKLEDKRWNIVIIEQDVPCAEIAIKDFKILLNHLINLEGNNTVLPEISLTVIESKEKYVNNSNFQKSVIEYDLLIDISILSRNIFEYYPSNIVSKEKIIIRSTNSKKSTRIFNTGELIEYKPILSEENSKRKYFPEKIKSLEYLLQSIFRKSNFRTGQLEILNHSLQLKSVVGLLPTGSGKSLTYQLSALLQPGVTLIVDPIKSLMKDQHQGLLKQRIDCSVFINSSIKSAVERQIATEKMIKANVLFVFISPERLQIRDFRESIFNMYNNYSNTFSYCIIDEAHCVSEWGHDFRTSYLRLGENARKFCKIKNKKVKTIPLIGLTATASFDVLSDIQRELGITENDIVSSENLDRPELIYKVIELNSDTKLKDKKELGEIKQEKLIELLTNIPKDFERHLGEINNERMIVKNFDKREFYLSKNKQKNAGLIFCPHKTWVYGVASVATKIKNNFQELKVGTFVGSSGEDELESLENSQISEINQDLFINDQLDILVATKAFGMGIDKPNIRFTIHFNYPSSVESFYQEAGRAGRDGRLAICYIIYTSNPIEQDILMTFHKNSFKGKEKEKRIIFELLDKISYSTENKVSILSENYEEEFGQDLTFNLWPKDKPQRLYVNQSYGKGYGYIKLENNSIITDGKHFTEEESKKVLLNTLKIIERQKKDKNLKDWLTEVVKKPDIDGIEKQLSKIKTGESLSPIVVGFRNDKIRQITNLLGEKFTDRIVKQASKFCFNSVEFIENLTKEYWKVYGVNIRINSKEKEQTEQLFNKIRDELDTFKAIYRLSIIGVIEDYQVDYNTKTITLYGIKKKEEKEYIDNLYKYIRRYVSKSRSDKVYEQIKIQKGNTTIQKCLGYLIDFVYDEIAKKREQAIIEMRDACNYGAKKGHEIFREYLTLYFNSKYYPELRNKTKSGKVASFNLVIEYIDITEGKIDNFKHLRGAVIRLLIENPDNYALLLLKTFTMIMLETNIQDFINEARESYKNGFNLLKNENNLDTRELINKMKKYYDKIIFYNSDLSKILTNFSDMILYDEHYEWLKQFNKKFMVKHG